MSIDYGLYRIWCRPTGVPDALWADMPFTRRSRQAAEELMEYYEREWGNHYIYEVHRDGFYPPGSRQPCFVGIND